MFLGSHSLPTLVLFNSLQVQEMKRETVDRSSANKLLQGAFQEREGIINWMLNNQKVTGVFNVYGGDDEEFLSEYRKTEAAVIT